MLKLLSLGLAGFAVTHAEDNEHARDRCPAVTPLDMCMQYCGKRSNYSLCRVLCMKEEKCLEYNGCPDCDKIKKTWKLACGVKTVWDHDLQLCVGADLDLSPSEQEIFDQERWEKVVGARFCGDMTEWNHNQKKCLAVGSWFCGKGTMWDKKSGSCVVSKKFKKQNGVDIKKKGGDDFGAEVKQCGESESKVKRGYVALTSRVSSSCECEKFCKTVSKGEFHRAWLYQTVKARNKPGKCSCFAGGDKITVAPGKAVAGMIEF